MAGIPPDRWANLLNTGKHSDFTIICEDVEFKVHSAVVCTASPMLDAAFAGPFKEANTRQINFPEEKREIVGRPIRFMYTNDYDDSEAPHSVSKPDKNNDQGSKVATDDASLAPFGRMTVNALVYKCADMLGINNLRTVACEKFVREARSACAMEGFAQPLKIMFESTLSNDTELRLAVVRICLDEYPQVKKHTKTVEILKTHEPIVLTIFTQMPDRVDPDTHKELKSSFLGLASFLSTESTMTFCRECHTHRAYCNVERDPATREVISVDFLCNEHPTTKQLASFSVPKVANPAARGRRGVGSAIRSSTTAN
ncbi:hypothetical protein LTR84_012636 [Exophiala bonariae]|uniref:BTB domain-containing protein n=1 Tax=Exophiala bonariae TaxID=1690606 RepID=A0AAV9NF07_9EURO|nr:hypothetical protein LTR84_012636 [Exophiala bonariae]